ncbi:MAG: DNA translocase FtsK 4TM domain-containing protein, partial [Candidatus Binatia bacterium]
MMERGSRLNREIWGVVVFVLALLITLSLFSYDPRDRSLNTPSGSLETLNWGGIVGAYLADFLLQGLGLSAYLFSLFLFLVSYNLFREPYQGIRLTKAGGYALLLWSVAILLSLLNDAEVGRESGGVIGDFSKEFLISLFSRVGAYVIVLSVLLLSVMSVTQSSLVSSLERGRRGIGKLQKRGMTALEALNRRWRERRERRRAENTKKERREFVPPPIVLKEDVKKEEAPKRAKKKSLPTQEQFDFLEIGQGYAFPSLAFLDSPDGEQVRIDKGTLEANSLILQKKLAD